MSDKLKDAVHHLTHNQKQADMDGVTVTVSREALSIVLDAARAYSEFEAKIEGLKIKEQNLYPPGLMSTARLMVYCEALDAVLEILKGGGA